MPLTLKAINQLDMAKTPIAVEVTASTSELRAWVAVYPRKEKSESVDSSNADLYLVKRFEYKRGMEDSYDTDLYTSNSEELLVHSIPEVERVLNEWGVDAGLLVPPWKCDFPL